MSMKRLEFRGRTLNWRTVDMIETAEKIHGSKFSILQGSYNKGGVSASAGTHDGGGAVDCWPTASTVDDVVLSLRKVGFAAWRRYPIPNLWGSHVHAIALDDTEASLGAKTQMHEYRVGQDGLAGHNNDNGPRIRIVTWEQYVKAHPNVMKVSLYRAALEFSRPKPQAVLGATRIQRCLNDKLGADLTEDGVAGKKTRDAYKSWQKHLKYKRFSGIPTYYSLSRLLSGRYHTSRVL